MICNSIQRRLDAYLDQELSTAESAAVRDHVRTCAACAAALDARAALGSRLQADAIPEVPADLAARILRQAEPQLRRAPRRRLQVVWWDMASPVARAAAVLLLMVGLTAGTLLGLGAARGTPAPVAVAAPPADPASAMHADVLSESPTGSAAEVYWALATVTVEGR